MNNNCPGANARSSEDRDPIWNCWLKFSTCFSTRSFLIVCCVFVVFQFFGFLLINRLVNPTSVFGEVFTDIPDRSVLSALNLNGGILDLKYCKTGACSIVEHSKGFKYRDYVCPPIKAVKSCFSTYESQASNYHQMMDAFFDLIGQVKTDLPMEERYIMTCNPALELGRDGGYPIPYHHDLDIHIRRSVLVAARDQGFAGNGFGYGNLKFDVNPEAHLDRKKRKWMHGWGDDGGFSNKCTRFQFGEFEVFDTLEKPFYGRKTIVLSFITDPSYGLDPPEMYERYRGQYLEYQYVYPGKYYDYLGFKIRGHNDFSKYLRRQYGDTWWVPLYICDPATKKWEKHGTGKHEELLLNLLAVSSDEDFGMNL